METKPLRRKSVKAVGSVASFSDDDIKMAIADFKNTQIAELPIATTKLPIVVATKRIVKIAKEFV